MSALPPHLQALISQPIQSREPESLAARLIAGTAPPPADAREKRNRELALHHADLIQRRKDAENEIFDSLVLLLDYPTSSTSSALHPLPADVVEFQNRMPPFTTDDYDDLLKERALADKCAYIFCPNEPTKDRSTTRDYNRILRDGKGGVKVVKRSELEMWCSPACAKRALYIKVQLNETPVWERADGLNGRIELLREDDDELLSSKMRSVALSDSRSDAEKMTEAMEELALERGEKTTSIVPRLVMDGSLVERTIQRPPQAPTGTVGRPGLIEGYSARDGRRDLDESDEASEGEDMDWDLR